MAAVALGVESSERGGVGHTRAPKSTEWPIIRPRGAPVPWGGRARALERPCLARGRPRPEHPGGWALVLLGDQGERI